MIGHGRCVLARSLSPNREKEEAGALKTFKTDAELILGLEELLQNPELRARYEEGARRYADSVKWSPNTAERHIDLYNSLL